MIIKDGNKSTTAYSKVLDLLDPGSFMETGEHISARLTSFYAPDEVQESDGVITGYGTIDDKLVFGELTFSSNGAVMSNYKEEFVKSLGDLLELPEKLND